MFTTGLYTCKFPQKNFSSKSKIPFEKESLLLRKRLSLTLASPKFDLKDLCLPNHILRKIFKYSFTKKIKKMTFEYDVFAYYAPFIPNSLQKTTFKKNEFLYKKSLKFNKKLAVHSFESLKHLKQLEINKEVLFGQIKAIRKIPSLEQLSLTISENNIPDLYNLFRGLFRLETVELLILKDIGSFSPWKPEKISLAWRFLKDLIKLKKLKTLRLNIQNCFISKDPGFFYRLLGILSENSNIDTLDLTLHLFNYKEDEQNEGAKRILSQVQALEIKSSQYSVTYFDFNKTSFQQKSMRLSLLPSDEENVFDISKIVAKCPNLKSLDVYDCIGKLVVSPDVKFTANLEIFKVNIAEKKNKKILNILRYLSNCSQHSDIRNFSVHCDHFTDDILKELAKINSGISSNKIEEYFVSTRDVYPPLEDENFRDSETLNHELFCCFLEGLSKFTSLKKFTLFTRIEERGPIKSLENSLNNLTDLTVLELQIYGEHDGVILIDLPVENLIKLQDFSLKLSFNFKFKDFLEFLERLSKIQELEYLVIDCIDIDPRNEDIMKKISKTLDKFAKVRRIYVYREQEDDEDLCVRFIDAESEISKN